MGRVFMRMLATTLFILVSATPLLAATAEEGIKWIHSKYCPTEAPCNYCTVNLRNVGWLPFCGPVNEPWGVDCRCKSLEGWQNGKVFTVYPDRPFRVNWE